MALTTAQLTANPTSVYVGLSNSAILTGAGEQSLLPATGQGSLTVPANAFKVGDSYCLVMAGEILLGDGNDDFTLKVYQNGTVLGDITVTLENTAAGVSFWEVEVDFTVRAIGATGSMCTNLDFTFNKNITKDFKGSRHVTITTLDTTTTSSLSVTGEVVGQNNSSLVTNMMILHRVFSGT
tara:strand:+ start:12091 stop:12633 length:543 start_codon:yes stop_codon:yes gene_type:complete